MAKFDVFRKYGSELERRIRLQTYPLAVKMLEKESDIPEGAKRPLRDFGHHTKTCQDFTMSRLEGITVTTTFEDMYCPEAVIGYGLAEPPQYFFDGYQRFPQTVESLEAGSIWAREFPKLEVGKYIGVVSAPLTTVNFTPDVVVLYVNSAQLRMLLLAVASKEGHELTCPISAKGACVYSVVLPLQTGSFQVTIPCPGDSRYAAAQHDEIIFSFPIGTTEQLLTSLRYLEHWGYKLPFRHIMNPEADHPGNYAEVGRMMGMYWMKGNDMAKYR